MGKPIEVSLTLEDNGPVRCPHCWVPIVSHSDTGDRYLHDEVCEVCWVAQRIMMIGSNSHVEELVDRETREPYLTTPGDYAQRCQIDMSLLQGYTAHRVQALRTPRLCVCGLPAPWLADGRPVCSPHLWKLLRPSEAVKQDKVQTYGWRCSADK